MNTVELVNQLENNSRTKLTEVVSKDIGIYAIYVRGVLSYIGKTENKKGGFSQRIGKEHTKGNSCVSSFINYLRVFEDLHLPQEVRDLCEIKGFPLSIAERYYIQDFVDKHVTVSLCACDPKEILEDIDMKPEDYLFKYYNDSIWNNITRQNKEVSKLSLEEYKNLIFG